MSFPNQNYNFTVGGDLTVGGAIRPRHFYQPCGNTY